MNTVEFGSLFHFIRNGMNIKQDKSGEGLPITRIETIADARVDGSRVGYAGLKESDCLDWIMEPGDILFSHINSVEHIGKCAVYHGTPEKLVHGMNLLCLRCNTKKLLPEFAKYLIRGPFFRSKLYNFINKAVNQASVSIGNLKTIPVSVPSLEEQKRIADILDRAEALRAKRRAALAQLDELSQSIFTEIFGDPLKNPMGWSTTNLEDICSIITDGEHATPKRTESGIYLLSARNIQNHSLSLDNVDFIDKDEYDRISKRIIPQKGDILVSCSGTIGRVAQVKECFKFQLVRSVALLRPETTKVNPTYLEYNFDSIYLKKQIEKSVNQSSQANLFQGKIRKLKIPLPPLEIQDKFAEVTEQLEKIKKSQQQSLLEINSLFDSLTHEAFTGKLFSHQFFEQKIENGVQI